MAHRLRRYQDDRRAARPAHPPLRHRRDRQRKLALQDTRLRTEEGLIRLRHPDRCAGSGLPLPVAKGVKIRRRSGVKIARRLTGRGTSEAHQRHRGDGMRRCRHAGREERVEPAQQAELQHPRCDLRRADQRSCRDGDSRAGPGGLQKAWQMRGHGGRVEPGRGKDEGQQHSARRDGGGPSSTGVATPAAVLVPFGSHAFSGNATARWISAQPRQASRQPHVASISPESGQPTVLAIPAMRVMPVIGPRASLP